MSDLTAEEFVRNKIREQRQINGEMRALWTYKVSGEDALRWAHEFAQMKANCVNSKPANCAIFDVSQRSKLLAFKQFISKTPLAELEYYSDEEFTDLYLKANRG